VTPTALSLLVLCLLPVSGINCRPFLHVTDGYGIIADGLDRSMNEAFVFLPKQKPLGWIHFFACLESYGRQMMMSSYYVVVSHCIVSVAALVS